MAYINELIMFASDAPTTYVCIWTWRQRLWSTILYGITNCAGTYRLYRNNTTHHRMSSYWNSTAVTSSATIQAFAGYTNLSIKVRFTAVLLKLARQMHTDCLPALMSFCSSSRYE